MDLARWLALATVAAACLCDVRSRKIPNTLTFGAALAAVVCHAWTGGMSAVGIGLAGWVAGCLLFFPLFALGGMGAGDVKLLAAVGAWLGPSQALWVALYGSLAGGVMALGVAVARRYTGEAIANICGLLLHWRVAGFRPQPGLTLETSTAPKLPFAFPLAAGTVAAIWFR
jgi:prepilin peptidase CpaA